MFANKTQSSLSMTLTSLSICGICGSLLRHQNNLFLPLLAKYVVFFGSRQIFDVPSLSHPITNKAYVELIGVEIARTYLQCICCLVKPWIWRNLSYNQINMCMCGLIWWLK
jgi:hypothetical protein